MTSNNQKQLGSLSWRVGPFVLGALVAVPRLLGCSSDDSNGGTTTTPDASTPVDSSVVQPGDDDDAAPTTVDSGVSAVDAGHDSGVAVDAGAGVIGPLNFSISPTGHSRFYTARYDAAGHIFAVGVVADGIDGGTDYAMVVAKFSGTGVLDTTFGANGYAIKNVTVGYNGEFARGLVFQSDGKIVISGMVEHVGGDAAADRDIAAVRFSANGALDTTFGTQGVAIVSLSDGAPNGNAYLADGHWSLNVDATDRLIINGSMKDPNAAYTDFAVLRLTKDGAVDTSFGDGGIFSMNVDGINAGGRNGTLLDGGSIVGAGYVEANGSSVPVVYKLTPNGQLDTSFGDGGVFHRAVLGASTETYAAVAQGDKLVTTGYGKDQADASLDFVSLRLTSTGALDTTYGTNGATKIDIGGYNDNSRYLLVLPDNRVVLVGGGRPTSDNVDGVVAVLTENGQPDTTFAAGGFKLFDLGGPADFLWGAALSPSKDHIAVVGIKGVGSQPGHDEASLLILPVPH